MVVWMLTKNRLVYAVIAMTVWALAASGMAMDRGTEIDNLQRKVRRLDSARADAERTLSTTEWDLAVCRDDLSSCVRR